MITLVLGGVRSGKSEVAERLAGPGPGTYLATGLVAPGDDDFAARVARHRARRPAGWVTVEEPRAVAGVLARLHGPVLLDALGTWIANDLRPDIDGLVAALVSRRGDTVVVSEEVGLGVHPVSEVGRLFADRLGEANRRVAEVADRCLLVVAGRVIDLPAGGAAPAGPAAPWPGGPATADLAAAPGAAAGSVRGPTTADLAAAAGGAAGPPGAPATADLAAPPGDLAGPGGAPATPDVAAAPDSAAVPTAAPATADLAAGPGEPTGFAARGRRVIGGAVAGGRPAGAPASAGDGFRQALAFLTPLWPAAAPTPAALTWFPVVGAMIGLILGGLWWAAEGPMGPLPAAALVVAADLVVTGALHFDGLLDSADGLLPHLRPERRLAVMADPHAGAFAVAVGASALLLRTAALAGFGAVRPWLLVVLWCLSRTAMAVTALTGRYARSHGLASAFLAEPASPSAGAPAAPAPTGSEPSPGDATARPAPSRPAPIPADASAPPAPPKPAPLPADASAPPASPKPAPNVRVWLLPAAIGAVLSLGLAVAGDPKSVVALVAAGLAAAGVAWLARRRIGGFTGDTLGAAGVVSETVGLLTAVAVLHR